MNMQSDTSANDFTCALEMYAWFRVRVTVRVRVRVRFRVRVRVGDVRLGVPRGTV